MGLEHSFVLGFPRVFGFWDSPFSFARAICHSRNVVVLDSSGECRFSNALRKQVRGSVVGCSCRLSDKLIVFRTT